VSDARRSACGDHPSTDPGHAFYLLLGVAARATAQISVTPWPAPGGGEPTGLLYDVAEIDREQRGTSRRSRPP